MSAEPGGRSGRRPGLTARLGEVQARDDAGSTATEYALLAGFIAVVIAVAVGLFGSNLLAFFNSIETSISSYI